MNASQARGWLLVGLLTVSAVAHAQPTTATEGRETREAREAREAAEAMERARRLAANPLLRIQEASRLRRRAEAEAVAPAAAPATADAVARAAAPGAREAVPPVEPASLVMNSELVQTRVGAGAAPALDPQPPAALQTAAALPGLVPLGPGIARPTLVSRVDPEVPARVLVELDANTLVAADLTIRPDGSVADVAIVSPNARALARYVVPALMQWRFEPLPGERQWRVELVFRAE